MMKLILAGIRTGVPVLSSCPERFASFPMDETHRLAAARCVEMNPVAAGLVANPGDYRWSSARAHPDGNNDALAPVAPLLEMVGDWSSFLSLSPDPDRELMRKQEHTGQPLGKAAFVENLEQTMGGF